MSAYWGRPEVIGVCSKRREWPHLGHLYRTRAKRRAGAAGHRYPCCAT